MDDRQLVPCPQCGYECPPEFKFCPECGSRLGEPTAKEAAGREQSMLAERL